MKVELKEAKWLNLLSDKADKEKILSLRASHVDRINDPRWKEFSEAYQNLEGIKAKHSDYSGDTIEIGKAEDFSKEELEKIVSSFETFIPWKKGPFNIAGEQIDTEWRSDLKWNRLAPHISSLEDKVVADIGCHNGYFMYRMLKDKPKHVIGFEPVGQHWFNFQMLNDLLEPNQLSFELFGVEHMELFEDSFDTIFCLGILYHHTDPIGLLRQMKKALKSKGELWIDCQGIAGDQPVAYMPDGKYTGARGFWFLPTTSCLINWVKRAGFQHSLVVFDEMLQTEEQRPSKWAPIKSLENFLDPEDPTKTIEGHPAPKRIYLRAKV